MVALLLTKTSIALFRLGGNEVTTRVAYIIHGKNKRAIRHHIQPLQTLWIDVEVSHKAFDDLKGLYT